MSSTNARCDKAYCRQYTPERARHHHAEDEAEDDDDDADDDDEAEADDRLSSPKGSPIDFRFESIDRLSPKGSPLRDPRSIESIEPSGIPDRAEGVRG